MKILVCASFTYLTSILEFLFHCRSWDVIIAPDRTNVRHHLAEDAFDLVLIEHDLDGPDRGLALCAELTRRPGFDTPILLLTPYHSPRSLQRAEQSGATGTIEQPPKHILLVPDVIQRAVELHRAVRTHPIA